MSDSFRPDWPVWSPRKLRDRAQNQGYFAGRLGARGIKRSHKGSERLHIVTLVLSLLLLASSVHADESHRFRLPMTLLAAAGAADVTSTMFNAGHNARYSPGAQTEHNPLIAWMEPKMGTGPMLAIAGAVEVGAFWVACHRWCETHPGLMRTAMLLGASAHGLATAGNVLSARDAAANRRRLGIQ